MPQDNKQAGFFISLEGGEGAGKSTQIKKLASWLETLCPEREIITSREPGGTESAEAIRALLVQGETDRFRPKTDALLMLASRVEHVECLIKPALERGAILLIDRFADSSYVYQSLSGGYSLEDLRALHKRSIGEIEPDVTYLFDLDPEIGLQRAGARLSQVEARFENKGLEFHKQVREAYLNLAQDNQRFEILDAAQNEDMLFDSLSQSILKHLRSRQLIADD